MINGRMRVSHPDHPEGTSMAARIRTTIISHFEQVAAEVMHAVDERAVIGARDGEQHA